MSDQRKHDRWFVLFYSRVFDRSSDRYLGYLGNITVEGMMVISEYPLDVGIGYRVRLELPEEIYNSAVLDLEAVSRWCTPDVDPKYYNTGFEFTLISDEDVDLIEQLANDAHVQA